MAKSGFSAIERPKSDRLLESYIMSRRELVLPLFLRLRASHPLRIETIRRFNPGISLVCRFQRGDPQALLAVGDRDSMCDDSSRIVGWSKIAAIVTSTHS
jgi:hypothetical protein